MLYIIGIGIHDEKDISLKGIDAAKRCEKVFMELYTCPLNVDVGALEKKIGRKIEMLERSEVEERNAVIESAKKCSTAFLVGGDALSATTHITIALDAKKAGIPVEIIHGSSIFTGVAETGLQLYKFGATVSLPKPQDNYSPDSLYDIAFENKKLGLHTLILLDIGMTANNGLRILLSLEKKKKKGLFSGSSEIVVVAHLGKSGTIAYGSILGLMERDFGALPHALILPGKLHFVEEEYLSLFK